MSKKDINNNIRISEGNVVLKQTDDTGFLIFNLPVKITCPYATEWCKKCCYALTSEVLFKSVVSSRMENFKESQKDTFANDMIDIIEYHISRKKYKDKKIFFRFHESGDIYSKDYFDKIIQITNHFEDRKDKIIFQTYTKSLPIISDYDLKDINIKILYSVVEDTKEEDILRAKNLDMSLFIASYNMPKTVESSWHICDGDCSKCKICYEENDKDQIYVENHGSRVKRQSSGRIGRTEDTKSYLRHYENKENIIREGEL